MALVLVLPASASAADPALSGLGSIAEGAGKATYTFSCGDTPNALSTPLLPLPPVPNTGGLTVSVAGGPSPAATQDADYGAPSASTVECTALTPQHTLEVPILDDGTDEPNERYTVTLSGILADADFSQSVVTAIADDDVPTASIGGLVRVAEGDSGTAVASLTVSLSQTPVEPATIRYATENGSAVAGADYAASASQLVIPAGQTTGTISVPIVGDTVVEPVEAFYVNLTSADRATIDGAKSRGAVAIFDNDREALPAVSVGPSTSVKEGNAGTVDVSFTVALSSPASRRVEVKWKTVSASANLADYVHGAGTVVFEPGQAAKTITVKVKGDLRDEPEEAFTVVLESATGATLKHKSAIGAIADDDGPKVKIARPVVRPKAIRVALTCPTTAEGCNGRLTAARGKLKLGRAKFTLARGASKTVKLKLSRKARKALRKRALRVKLKAVATDASGGTRVASRTARLRLR